MNSTPLLPLDKFRRIIGFAPYAFWGLADEHVPIDSQCNTAVFEYAYQNSSIAGRSEIREAMAAAEERLRGYLNFPVAPKYVEAVVDYPKYLDQRMIRVTPIDSQGGWVGVFTPDAYVIAAGIENLNLIDTPSVVYSDEYSTGVDDTFTLTVSTDETDPNKIAVYFAAADRLDNSPLSADWRIEPVNVQITGGIATIIGRAWLLVKPILRQGFKKQNYLSPAVTANFVTTLDVCVRETNPNGTTLATAQGEFSWNANPNFNWFGFCCSDSSDPSAVAHSIARVGIKDGYIGLVTPGEAIYNATTQTWQMTIPPWSGICRPPNSVTLRYLAGYPLDDNGQVDERLARAIVFLAAADMADRICACSDANRTLMYYQQEMNRTGNIQQETFAVTRQQLNNPLGNRRGHWYAWNEINALRLPRGVTS